MLMPACVLCDEVALRWAFLRHLQVQYAKEVVRSTSNISYFFVGESLWFYQYLNEV